MKTQHLIVAGLAVGLSLSLVNVVHTATTKVTLEERVRKQEDTEAIRSLLIAYGRILDRRDFKAYGELFAEDGSYNGSMGSATSPEGIAKMVADGFGRMAPSLYENSNHVMTSPHIEVNGDTAKAWSRWLWVVVGSDGRPRTERAGHYEDALVRENGQWKFKQRLNVTEINK